MQVKKFEASSMKEALATVKRDLGPDAIILAAKEAESPNQGVMVTAAVSANQLNKKKVAQKKMTKEFREKFELVSALKQREFIENSLTEESPKTAVVKRQPYIEIGEQEGVEKANSSSESNVGGWHNKNGLSSTNKPVNFKDQLLVKNRQIRGLKTELNKLRTVIKEFQKVPQSFLKLHPGAKWDVPFELSFVYDLLRKKGVNNEICLELIKETQNRIPMSKMTNRAFVSAFVVQVILDQIVVVPIKSEESKYHVFVGPSGQGKTNTLLKMAAQWSLNEKKHVAIVSLGDQHIGARGQLKIFSQILNIPFVQIDGGQEWDQLNQQLRGLDHILVDCPGVGVDQSKRLDAILSQLPPDDSDRRVHYVLSSLARDEEAKRTVQEFSNFPVDDTIFTRIDECLRPGVIINFQKFTGWPLHSFGIGQEVPEDLELATQERVADLIFDLAKFSVTEKLAMEGLKSG